MIVTITRSIREALTDQGGKSAGERRSGNRSGGSSKVGEDPDRSRVSEFGERALRFAEDAVYVAVAILLVVGALVLLVDAAGELAGLGDGADSAVLALLDRLLLVFVLVELIFAVRMTLSRREIIAELVVRRRFGGDPRPLLRGLPTQLPEDELIDVLQALHSLAKDFGDFFFRPLVKAVCGVAVQLSLAETENRTPVERVD